MIRAAEDVIETSVLNNKETKVTGMVLDASLHPIAQVEWGSGFPAQNHG